MPEIRFEVRNKVDEATGHAIFAGLVAFNDSKVEKSTQQDLLVTARSASGALLGGLRGHTHREWLYVSQIWVLDQVRGDGVGSSLMRLAEDEAQRRGCFAAYLNTFSFQALKFYQGLGYEVFGELEDFPRGHKRIFLKKIFSRS